MHLWKANNYEDTEILTYKQNTDKIDFIENFLLIKRYC